MNDSLYSDRTESGLLTEVVIVPCYSSKGHKVSTLITRGSPCVSVAVEWLKIWGRAATFNLEMSCAVDKFERQKQRFGSSIAACCLAFLGQQFGL